MKTITLHLPDDTAAKMDQVAQKLGLSIEALVQASVEEKLERFEMDFDQAAARVLQKNAELYRRLA